MNSLLCSCGKHPVEFKEAVCSWGPRAKVTREQKIKRWKEGDNSAISTPNGRISAWFAIWLKEEANFICQICGWSEFHPLDGMPGVQIDHIDGNNRNHSLENLRIICLICHWRTETYCGRNIKKLQHERCPDCSVLPHKRKKNCKDCQKISRQSRPRNKKSCADCLVGISPTAKRCLKCSYKKASHPTKINWPDDIVLQRLVFEKPMIHLAKDLGVSDQAIKNRCTKRGIVTPGRGYFLKKS